MMRSSFQQVMRETAVPAGHVAIGWLGQAGFLFKSSTGVIIAVDAYLSDLAERLHGFKRIVPSPLSAEEMDVDLLLATHHHADHLDLDTIARLAVARPNLRFGCPPSCVVRLTEIGIPPDRIVGLRPGDCFAFRDVRIAATYADHGSGAPDAIGLAMDFGGVRVWHTGDTGFRPDRVDADSVGRPQLAIVCINGYKGNCTPEEAARLVAHVGASGAVPCHFWMFVAHGGDPRAFLDACRELAPAVRPEVMPVGGVLLYPGP